MTSRTLSLIAVAWLGAAAGFAQIVSQDATAPEVRHAFVTADTFDADLGGVAGADQICRDAALAAGLDNPDGFVAWISDSTSDAYCRAQGLTGKRSADCGQGSPPAAAGPWVRVDGAPFADRIDRALDPTGRVLMPLVVDEDGVEVDEWATVWTSTDGDGQVHPVYPVPCADWHSNAAGPTAGNGSSWTTTVSWLTSGHSSCSSFYHLVCLESGPALPLPPHRSGGALAFVTSVSGSGDLHAWPQAGGAEGLAAGDAICESLATAAGLPRPESFLAWLSGEGTAAVDRFSYDGAWVRPDGVRVAVSVADLTDRYLEAPINVDETGAYWANDGVWTGTHHSGAGPFENCDGWGSASGTVYGLQGTANRAGSEWTYYTTAPCSSNYLHLYCLADFPAVVFVDDYESGGTSAWSTTAPAP